MCISSIKLKSLRNDAHFWFHSEMIKLLQEFGAELLQIAALMAVYLALLEKLDAALKKIVKSAATDKIYEADKERDAVYSGFVQTLKGLCEHFDPATRDKALKVAVVTHTYGNVSAKPINEETSAIYNLVQELNTDKYKTLVANLGLTPWVNKLEQQNDLCEALIQERDRENAAKNHTAVKTARREIDETYKRIVERLNALLVLEQLTGCEGFVDTMNEIIHRFSIKHHRHKHGAQDAETAEGEEGSGAEEV